MTNTLISTNRAEPCTEYIYNKYADLIKQSWTLYRIHLWQIRWSHQTELNPVQNINMTNTLILSNRVEPMYIWQIRWSHQTELNPVQNTYMTITLITSNTYMTKFQNFSDSDWLFGFYNRFSDWLHFRYFPGYYCKIKIILRLIKKRKSRLISISIIQVFSSDQTNQSINQIKSIKNYTVLYKSNK